jgi:REP element-mobilizing transposase RayT
LPIRKNIRLQEYDYSQAGYYFITICVKDKHETLGEIVVGANCVRPTLTETGKIVENEICTLSSVYENVFIDNYVIMPNHIHMIIVMADNGRTQTNDGRTQFAPTISRIIKQLKGSITKQLGFSLWQRSFHDRIIRDEGEYRRIWQYIDENPARWDEDEYFTRVIAN